MVAGGIASGASAHVLTPDSCPVLSVRAVVYVSCPGAPTLLTATAGDGTVTLTWAAPDGDSQGDTYNVYQGTSPGGETASAVNLSPITDTTYKVPDLTNGTTYYFTVTAANGAGEGPASNEMSATPVPVPGAPTGLTATAGNRTVTLSWAAPDGGSQGDTYNVYQGTSPGGETASAVNLSPITDTSYKVPDLTNGTTYYFTVTAANEAGNSKPSNEVSATPATVPGPPLRLTATPGDGKVTLTWAAPRSDGGSDVTGYNIYYATSADFKAAAKIPWGTDTAVTVTGLVNGIPYNFWVTAVNGAGEGKPPKEVPATRSACRRRPLGWPRLPVMARWPCRGPRPRPMAGRKLPVTTSTWRLRLTSRLPPRSPGARTPP